MVVSSLTIPFPLVQVYESSIFEFLRGRLLLPHKLKLLREEGIGIEMVVSSLTIPFPLVQVYGSSIFEFLRGRLLLPHKLKLLREEGIGTEKARKRERERTNAQEA